MKHLFLTLSSIVFFVISNAQNPKLTWAKGIGGTTSEYLTAVAVDATGNVYSCGFFKGTMDFDPGAATFNLISAGNNDIFVTKFDVSGNFVWAKRIGGSLDDFGNYMKVDATGNVIITGQFKGTVDFDPGAGTSNLISKGLDDIFILKLDASGNFLWVKQMGGTSIDYGIGVALDATGNIYITGGFGGTVDFDPGAGTSNLTSVGNGDAFVTKLDATGNFVWAKSIGGSSDDEGKIITLDASGNVYIAGSFTGIVDFDPGAAVLNLTSSGTDEIYILKLNSLGNFIWAKQLKGATNNAVMSIATDASGNVYTAGYFQGTVDFDPGTATTNIISIGSWDIFILKLDATGGLVWVKTMGGGGTTDDDAYSMSLDASGNVYVTGVFQGTTDFDPGAGTFNLTSSGGYDVFVAKLNAAGNFVWAIKIGGPMDDTGWDIRTDASGNFYASGYYSGTVDFDPSSGTSNLTASGSSDIYIVKMSQTALGIIEPLNTVKLNIYPNPTDGIINLELSNANNNDVEFQLLNNLGQVVMEEKPIKHSQYDIQNLTDGLYFVRILSNEKIIAAKKIIKQ